MSEFFKVYSSTDEMIRASHLVTDLDGDIDPTTTGEVADLLTPQEVLEQVWHEREIISVERYPTFDALLQARERIRKLELVPIRSEQSQAAYAAISKEDFLRFVLEHYLGQSEMALVTELYPSDLSSDVDQRVLWIRDAHIDDGAIARFIAIALSVNRLTLNDVILFERSRHSNTEFVRAAVPELRHIHMWTRKRILVQ